MRYAFLVLALSFLLVAGMASAADSWVSLDGSATTAPTTRVLRSDQSGLTLELTLHGFTAETVETRGGAFTSIGVPGCGVSTEVGRASLPVLRELVQLPVGALADVTVTVLETRTATLEELGIAHRIAPLQAPVEKVPGALESAPFVLDDAYYTSSAASHIWADVAAGGTMRGMDFAELSVSPLRYNPSDGTIEYATRIVVEVSFTGGDMLQTAAMMERYANPYVGKLARDLFINHTAYEGRYDIPLPIGYLIVTHDNFESAIQPLADWKAQKGYDVTVVATSDIPGGNTKENIKAYIEDAYDNWAVPPTFVLLVGDTGYISHWVGTQSDSPSTDLYYVTMDGSSDWQPDLWVGRFSCTSSAQVTNLVDKTVEYETFDLTSGTGWIKKAVFMASEDNYTVSEGTHNSVISSYLTPAGYTSQKLYMHTYNATTAQVSAAFNDGRGIGIYSGHGAITYWADGPQFTATNVNALSNGDMLPLVHSYSCLTGQFSTACFGETWINATNKGALVFWGSSVTSYWDEDDVLEEGTFEAFFGEDYTWACGISHRAMYHLYTHYSGGGSTRRYFEMYNILGDPSVDIWTDAPATFDASYAGSIPAGSTSFDVTVNRVGGGAVDHALVHVSKASDGVTETYYTNGSGYASIPLSPAPTTAGALSITITKHNYYPHEGSSTVSLADAPYVAYDSQSVDDDTSGGSSGNGDSMVDAGETVELSVTVENVGNQPAYGVSATLGTTDSYVTMIDAYEEYGDILVGGFASCVEDYDFEVDGSCPDGHSIGFELTATDGDSTWVSGFSITVGAPMLTVGNIVVDDAMGNGNGCAEPGETVEITVTLANGGTKSASGVTAVLSTSDPYVTISQDTATASLIGSGGSSDLTPDYTVLVLPTSPDPHEVVLSLYCTTALGYETSADFTLSVGGGIDEDFEGSGEDWTHSNITSGFSDEWHVETYRYHSSGHSWKFGGSGSATYGTSDDGALYTPSFCIGAEGELTFWDWLAAEEESSTSAWDCALVEISTNGGGSWANLAPVGGYSHAKNDNTSNPLPTGTPCWSGSHAWQLETFDLSAYEGETAIVRFRFVSDGYVSEEGWYVDDVNVTSTSTGVNDPGEIVPREFALLQNAPNPFNPVTTIAFALPEQADVSVKVYNMAGRVVRTLVDGSEGPGTHSVVWDGRDEAGRSVASGVYFYRMSAGDFSERRMMVLLK